MQTQFPGDTRVVEQISWIQRQEGAYRPAFPRYEQLVALCKDDYQRTQYRMPSNHGSASDLNSVYYAENRNNIERATHSAVRSLQWLVDRWEGDPAAALPRYELLRTLVFPSDREEFVYADRNRLLDEAPVTVSEKLFKIATEVHRLDELKQMLNARESPIPSIPWTVLRTQFAMAERDFGTASRMLEKLLERSQTEKSHVTLLAACQVAVPAFKIEELRKPALLILDEYVRRESASGSYPNTDFQLFPLVRMVSEYRQEQAGVPVENEK